MVNVTASFSPKSFLSKALSNYWKLSLLTPGFCTFDRSSGLCRLTSDTKFEKKLTCGLDNDMTTSVNFYHSTQKSQYWDFDEIFLSKVENAEV